MRPRFLHAVARFAIRRPARPVARTFSSIISSGKWSAKRKKVTVRGRRPWRSSSRTLAAEGDQKAPGSAQGGARVQPPGSLAGHVLEPTEGSSRALTGLYSVVFDRRADCCNANNLKRLRDGFPTGFSLTLEGSNSGCASRKRGTEARHRDVNEAFLEGRIDKLPLQVPEAGATSAEKASILGRANTIRKAARQRASDHAAAVKAARTTR